MDVRQKMGFIFIYLAALMDLDGSAAFSLRFSTSARRLHYLFIQTLLYRFNTNFIPFYLLFGKN